MASFSVDMGEAGTAYEKGVTMPSYRIYDAASNQAVALGKGIFDVLDDYAKAQQTSQASVNRQLYSDFAKGVNSIKGQNPTQARSSLNSLIAQMSSQGLEIGEAESKLVQTTLGINLDYLNANPRQAMMDKVNKTLQDSPAYYLLAKDKLIAAGNANPTEQEVFEKTISMIAQIDAANLISANAKTMSQAEWDATGNNTAILAIDNLRDLGMKTLDIEISGGNVSPETIQQLKASHIQLKNLYFKPQYVSEESYQGVKNRLDAIGELITAIEKYDTEQLANLKEGIVNKIDMAIIKQIEAEGISNPLMSRALLANMDKVTEVIANKSFPEIMTLMQGVTVDDLDFESVEIFEGLSPEETSTIEGPFELTPTDLLHNPNEIEKATTRSDSERQALINHGVVFNILALTPEAMNQEDARKNFLAGIDKVTLNVATSDKFVDNDALWSKEGLFSAKTYELLKKVETLDPQAANTARDQMKNALQAQANVFLTTMSGATANNIFEVKGKGEIGFKDNAALPPAIRSGLVQSFADNYYDGNIFNMIKDRGKKLTRAEITNLRGQGFDMTAVSGFYSEINDINQMVKRYADNWRKLGGDSGQFESMLLIKQEQGTTEAPVGSIAKPWNIPWSDDHDLDDKFFVNLPSNSYYFDINGDTRRKP